MGDEPQDGFLSRWSKRKQAIQAGETLSDPADQPEIVPNLDEDPERAAELLANKEAAEAIDIESLDYESDFSAFFKDGVPTLLKQQAMKVLWRSNPILANVDGLCDYDENFGDPKLFMGKVETAYRAGKGYLFPEDEEEVLVAEASEIEEVDDEAIVEDEEPFEDKQVLEEDEEQTHLASNQEPDTIDLDEEDEVMVEEVETPRVPLRKRMVFEA